MFQGHLFLSPFDCATSRGISSNTTSKQHKDESNCWSSTIRSKQPKKHETCTNSVISEKNYVKILNDDETSGIKQVLRFTKMGRLSTEGPPKSKHFHSSVISSRKKINMNEINKSKPQELMILSSDDEELSNKQSSKLNKNNKFSDLFHHCNLNDSQRKKKKKINKICHLYSNSNKDTSSRKIETKKYKKMDKSEKILCSSYPSDGNKTNKDMLDPKISLLSEYCSSNSNSISTRVKKRKLKKKKDKLRKIVVLSSDSDDIEMEYIKLNNRNRANESDSLSNHCDSNSNNSAKNSVEKEHNQESFNIENENSETQVKKRKHINGDRANVEVSTNLFHLHPNYFNRDSIAKERLYKKVNTEAEQCIILSDDSTQMEGENIRADFLCSTNMSEENDKTKQYVTLSDNSVSGDEIDKNVFDKLKVVCKRKLVDMLPFDKNLQPNALDDCRIISEGNITISDETKKLLLHVEEEEVDFPIPLLHSSESTCDLSEEEKLNLIRKGVTIRTGRFSKKEDSIILKNWNTIIEKFPVDDPLRVLLGMGNHVRTKAMTEFRRAKHIYVQLGHGLDDRMLSTIYYRARVLLNPPSISGEKISSEEFSQIRKLRNVYKYPWLRIAKIMGRSQFSCKNAYARWILKFNSSCLDSD